MILSVGLTGGLASGKSTVLRLLREHGCETVDADSIVSDLYRPGRPGHRALVEAYGAGILLESGEVDRGTLASIAFSDPAEARRLNALIHPLVIADEQRRIAAAEASGEDGIHVVEATLLIEAGGKGRYDRIVVVDVHPQTQIERAVGRGMKREDALRRIALQMPREERMRNADYVIDNNGTEAATREQVAQLMASLRLDLARKIPPGLAPGGV